MKTSFGYIATALVIAGGFCPIYADAIVDSEFDDNQNDFEYYWYYYDDLSIVAKGERSEAPYYTTPSKVDVPYDEYPRHALGNENDTLIVKQYMFKTTESFGKRCATVPFTLGEPWETYYCDTGKPCANFNCGF